MNNHPFFFLCQGIFCTSSINGLYNHSPLVFLWMTPASIFLSPRHSKHGTILFGYFFRKATCRFASKKYGILRIFDVLIYSDKYIFIAVIKNTLQHCIDLYCCAVVNRRHLQPLLISIVFVPYFFRIQYLNLNTQFFCCICRALFGSLFRIFSRFSGLTCFVCTPLSIFIIMVNYFNLFEFGALIFWIKMIATIRRFNFYILKKSVFSWPTISNDETDCLYKTTHIRSSAFSRGFSLNASISLVCTYCFAPNEFLGRDPYLQVLETIPVGKTNRSERKVSDEYFILE